MPTPPRSVPRPPPDERPVQGPYGPRTPYPVDAPGNADPQGPGSEPDYIPGSPAAPVKF